MVGLGQPDPRGGTIVAQHKPAMGDFGRDYSERACELIDRLNVYAAKASVPVMVVQVYLQAG